MRTLLQLTIYLTLQIEFCLMEGRGDGTLDVAINPDGSYSFSYDTNTGGFHSQMGSKKQVSGKYGFTSPDGNLNVQFSREPGFTNGNGKSQQSLGGYNGGGQSALQNGGGSGADGGIGDDDSGVLMLQLNPDGSYSYKYDLKDQGKSESRDIGGEVVGQYYYQSTDGKKKSIDYTAGIGGFQPSGDSIPSIDDIGTASNGGAANGGYSGGGYIESAGKADDDSGTLTLSLGSGGVYSYNYQLKSQAKSESRDASGKVKGEFNFIGTDGQKKSIQYTADESGFQPIGDHIPKIDGEESASSYGGSAGKSDGQYDDTYTDSSNGGKQSYSFNYKTEAHSRKEMREGKGLALGSYFLNAPGHQQEVEYSAGRKQGYQPTVEVQANVGGGKSNAGNGGSSEYGSGSVGSAKGLYSNSDDGSSSQFGGSYSFSYSAKNHNRQEEGSSGLIKGGYSIGSDGLAQKSSYTAGKEGFNPSHSIDIKLDKKIGNGNAGARY